MMNCWTSTVVICSLSTALLAAFLSFLSARQACHFLDLRPTSWNDAFFSTASPVYLLRQTLCGTGSLGDEPNGWNLFHHLGGNGPWIAKTNARFGTYEDEGKPAPGCVVDQVHMLSRHAERYPTANAGSRHLPLLSRLQTVSLNGSLSFLNDGNWTYFTPPAALHGRTFEDLTATSSYAGTLSAFGLGTTFRTRYSHLLTTADQKAVNFWSASSPRDVETALYFADGLFGRHWSSPNATNPARLHVIPENADRGGNTLTPGDSCLNYITDTTSGHDQGHTKLAEWQQVFTRAISARLAVANPALQPSLSPGEVYSLMELCGSETQVRGSSPWCHVFSATEWEDFEYARDLLHFYRAGPGNRYAKAMGHLWLNATAELLLLPHGQGADDAGTGQIYASFVHDGDIMPVIAALGLLDEEVANTTQGTQHLPTDRLKRDRNWRTSDMVPMAGRLVIERLNCHTPHGWRYRDVRLFVNDGWVGWPVTSQPEPQTEATKARSQEQLKKTKEPTKPKNNKKQQLFLPQLDVTRFAEMIRTRHHSDSRAGFRQVCGLDEKVQDHITFLHQ